MKLNFATFLFLLACSKSLAQRDSAATLLPPAVLSDTHIVKFKPQPQPQQFFSATRFAEEIDGLPFSVFVVTGEEILRNGYVTLADVLKNVPGIRVSQPGNAIEGETFLMRGLAGNQYVKVLVNDVPVKPTLALGMPIGAQLPIRQAERIEVLYGPASAIYGGDACAGVVNIILKESERPVFTKADLAFGRNGYNGLDLMFGGKFGKDQRIFRFTAWGSTTVREKLDVFDSETIANLLNVNDYRLFGEGERVWKSNENYLRNSGFDSIPRFAPLTHDSRVFGLRFNWRGIDFTYNRMRRFDHTALGLNPLAVSLGNSSNRLAERMEVFSAGFRARIGHLSTQNTLSAVFYRIDNASSNLPVFDAPFAALVLLAAPAGTPDDIWQTTNAPVASKYLSGQRFVAGNALDVRHELRTRLGLGHGWSLDAGWQLNFAVGLPMVRYEFIPPDDRLNNSDTRRPGFPFDPDLKGDFDFLPFANLNVRFSRLFLTGGLSSDFSAAHSKTILSSRLAGLFRVHKSWSVFGNWSQGFRRPSFFYYTNSFSLKTGAGAELARDDFYKKTERTDALEAGLRFRVEKTRLDASVFRQQVFDQIRGGYFFHDETQGSDSLYYYGFANAPGLSQRLFGVQVYASHNTLDWNFDLGNFRKFVLKWQNEASFQYSQGKEWFGHGLPNSPDVRNLPRWMWQVRSSWRSDRFSFVVTWNRQSAWQSGSIFYRDRFQRERADDRIPGFATWDFMLRQNLSTHLLAYFQFQNLFNSRHAGIDATGTADDLLFNPQQGRQWRLGINYNMN